MLSQLTSGGVANAIGAVCGGGVMGSVVEKSVDWEKSVRLFRMRICECVCACVCVCVCVRVWARGGVPGTGGGGGEGDGYESVKRTRIGQPEGGGGKRART